VADHGVSDITIGEILVDAAPPQPGKPVAILNFVLTGFIAYVLLQCFWLRNLKLALRKALRTLIGMVDELYRSLGPSCIAPWQAQPP
jgi:hypothetical protein